MTSQTEARQLRAQGIPITALDGRELRLIFDVDALAIIESDFGSLGGMQDALQQIAENGATAQFFTPVLKMMRAALAHDATAADARFDTALIGDYYVAVMKATDLAFPKAPTPTTTSASDETTHETNMPGYPGPTSITSLPSGSGDPMTRSGV